MAKKKKKRAGLGSMLGQIFFGSWARAGITLFATSVWAASQWPAEKCFADMSAIIFLVFTLPWVVKKFCGAVGEFFKI